MERKRTDSMLRSERGATAVEFALITPVLLLMILGIIEYNVLMYSQAVLEGATASAARTGRTGYVASGYSQQDYIQSIIKNRVTGLLEPTSLAISSKSYASFSAIGEQEPCISPTRSPCPGTPEVNFVDINHNGMWDTDQGAAGLGGSGDIVVYKVTYPWKVMTPIMRSFLGTSGIFTLTSSAVVRNEPYAVGSR